jgi:copper resistance protein B
MPAAWGAPADARDPHAYAGGQDFGPYQLRLGDTQSSTSLLLENFEVVRSDGNTSGAYDLQSWYGRTYDRVVLKAEGDIDDGQIADSRSELLWGHAITSYWDTQLGVRYDNGDGPDRSWLAFGVQGLAPYWFELEVTGYLGENGRTAVRLDASYELLFTQKLIFQPRLEADIYGKNDTANGLGSGLAEVAAQIRLRYEIRREFAPYIGVEWARKFGKTKDLARAAGEDASNVSIVAGLRYWF